MVNPEASRNRESVEELLNKSAESLYSAELPYHNFEHASKTVEKANEIIARCREEGIEVNEKVVIYSLLFHDAGYHEDHKEKGFDTKEEYAVELAVQELEKVGVETDVTEEVKRTILATHRDKPFITVEQKIARAADLAGLAEDYEIFVKNNQLLKQEYELMSNEKISWADWKKGTQETVEFYLGQDIRLTKGYEDKDGNSIFHIKTRENLDRFLADERFTD